MPKYCSNCGQNLKKGSKFCPNCGFSLTKEVKVVGRKKPTLSITLATIIVIIAVFAIISIYVISKPTTQPRYYQPTISPEEQPSITPREKECFQYAQYNICDNYHETRYCLSEGILELEEGIRELIRRGISETAIRNDPEIPDEIGIAHTTGNYVLTYGKKWGRTFFEIVADTVGCGMDVGFLEELENLGIKVTRYEVVWRLSDVLP